VNHYECTDSGTHMTLTTTGMRKHQLLKI